MTVETDVADEALLGQASSLANPPLELLVLGGTTEASLLVTALQRRAGVAATLSLAGRTATPAIPSIPLRIGGFGGSEGLAAYLARGRVGAVVDATHPFAARITANAAAACAEARVPLIAFTRPAWVAQAGDWWDHVSGIDEAVARIGPAPRRVFLTTGRLDIARFRAAPQHHYVIRTIDLPDSASLPPLHRHVQARGPFRVAAEEELMAAERIDVVVTKNSGGAATAGKLTAARNLGLRVIMVNRPAGQNRAEVHALADVLAWIEDQRGRP